MTTVTSNNEWNNNITRKNSRILSCIRSHIRIIKRKSYIFGGYLVISKFHMDRFTSCRKRVDAVLSGTFRSWFWQQENDVKILDLVVWVSWVRVACLWKRNMAYPIQFRSLSRSAHTNKNAASHELRGDRIKMVRNSISDSGFR